MTIPCTLVVIDGLYYRQGSRTINPAIVVCYRRNVNLIVGNHDGARVTRTVRLTLTLACRNFENSAITTYKSADLVRMRGLGEKRAEFLVISSQDTSFLSPFERMSIVSDIIGTSAREQIFK